MTTFDDITKTVCTGLDKLTSYFGDVNTRWLQGDQTLHLHKERLLGPGSTVQKDNIVFSGLKFNGSGADAFGQAVEANIGRSTAIQSTLRDFSSTTSQLKAKIVSINSHYDPQITQTSVDGAGWWTGDNLELYGYTAQGVLATLREAALDGLDMNYISEYGMAPYVGNGQWPHQSTGNLDFAADNILADIKHQHLRNLGQVPGEPPISEFSDDTAFQNATDSLNQIYAQLYHAMIQWYNEVIPAINAYANFVQNGTTFADYPPPT